MSVNLKPQVATVPVTAAAVAADNKARTLTVSNLTAYYGKTKAVEGVNLKFEPNTISALIGPSGCGKSTLIRTFNRMHEVITGAYATGEVLIDNDNIYAADADPVRIRRRIGMVF